MFTENVDPPERMRSVGVTDEELAWLAMMHSIKALCWDSCNEARGIWTHTELSEDLRERLYEIIVVMNAAVQQDSD